MMSEQNFFWEVKISLTSHKHAELLYSVLQDLSPRGIHQVDAPGEYQTQLRVYPTMGSTYDPDEVRRSTRNQVLDYITPEDCEIRVDKRRQCDPLAGFRKHLRPLQVGPILILPSGENKHIDILSTNAVVGPDADVAPILISGGMAFGTGHHATTRLALRGLIMSYFNNPFANLMDVGCGSGILSLVGLKLGARQAYGCDIEADAVKTARGNASVNCLSECLFLQCSEVSELSFEDWPTEYPFVVANLNLAVLRDNAETLRELSSRGGRMLLSGIYGDEQMEAIKAVYVSRFNMSEVIILYEGIWRAILLSH